MPAVHQPDDPMKSPVSASDEFPERDADLGWDAVTEFVEWDQTLPAGTRLRDYEVRSVIAESACAIVYLAWDHSLRRRVAIKEYLPRALAARGRTTPAVRCKHADAEAAYAAGLMAFVAEARTLARFDHAALVKVYRFWEDHGTAYMAMPLLEGPRLDETMNQGAQDEPAVRTWLRPVLDALSALHAARCFHQDIGPDSIVLTAGGPVLLGFSAASRLLASTGDDPAAGVKPGYAAIEQYGDAAAAAPGPWTDLYALAALVYRAISGEAPTAAPERLPLDPLPPLAQRAAGRGSAVFLQAIDATLALQPEHRPRDDTEFRELVGAMDAPLPALPLGPSNDLMTEPFGQVDDALREITVPLASPPSVTPTEPQGPAKTTSPHPPTLASDHPHLRLGSRIRHRRAAQSGAGDRCRRRHSRGAGGGDAVLPRRAGADGNGARDRRGRLAAGIAGSDTARARHAPSCALDGDHTRPDIATGHGRTTRSRPRHATGGSRPQGALRRPAAGSHAAQPGGGGDRVPQERLPMRKPRIAPFFIGCVARPPSPPQPCLPA